MEVAYGGENVDIGEAERPFYGRPREFCRRRVTRAPSPRRSPPRRCQGGRPSPVEERRFAPERCSALITRAQWLNWGIRRETCSCAGEIGSRLPLAARLLAEPRTEQAPKAPKFFLGTRG